jgi:putative FmdB family regulatory protein
MPVYVYQCSNCDYQFEQQQKFSDNPLKTCPNCGKPVLHKVYMPVGVIYKGSGFYSTDHRSSAGTTLSSTHSKKPSNEKKPKAESITKETSTTEKKS